MTKLFVDFREQQQIIDQLKEIFDVQVCTLEVGDYLYNNVLIEHKTPSDFISSISDGRVFKQCEDLLNVKNCYCYILISGKLRDFENYGCNMSSILGTIASLNRRGIPTELIDNIDYFIKYMSMLFEKYNDNKIRAVNPQRKQVTMQDKLENIYSNFPGLGPGLAKKLKDKYPTVKSLSTVTIKELKELNGFGPKRARQTFNFIHGIK